MSEIRATQTTWELINHDFETVATGEWLEPVNFDDEFLDWEALTEEVNKSVKPYVFNDHFYTEATPKRAYWTVGIMHTIVQAPDRTTVDGVPMTPEQLAIWDDDQNTPLNTLIYNATGLYPIGETVEVTYNRNNSILIVTFEV